MADNYLERREAELHSGKSSVIKVNPSLDTLIKRIAACTGRADEAYTVKQAQLDAIARSARILAGECTLSPEEASASIRAQCSDTFILGQKVMIMVLKAAELKLSCHIDRDTPDTVTLTFFRQAV